MEATMLRFLLAAFFCCAVLTEPALAIKQQPKQAGATSRFKKVKKKIVKVTRKAGSSTVRVLRAILNIPSELRGSKEGRIAQNERADAQGLYPIRNKDDEELVELPKSPYLVVDGRLVPPHQRYCRKCVVKPLLALAKDHYTTFGKPFRITGAFRSVEEQARMASYRKVTYRRRGKTYFRLVKNSINAAPASGPDASLHLRGTTIDFGQGQMTPDEKKWMQGRLIEMKQAEIVYPIQEEVSPCFHIVFCWNEPVKSPAQTIAGN
jgi:hypothetical protein